MTKQFYSQVSTKENETICPHEDLYSNVQAPLFATVKNWKPFKCLSTGQSTNKIWYIRTTDYYPAIKRNKTLIDAAIWINLKNMNEARFKDYIWYDSIYTKYSKKANLQSKAQTSGCLGLGVRMRVNYEQARGAFLEVTEMS